MQAVNAYGSSANCQTVVIKNDASSSSSNVCKVGLILFAKKSANAEYLTECVMSG